MLRFFVLTEQSLKTIDHTAVREFVAALNPTYELYSRGTLRTRLDCRQQVYWAELKDLLGSTTSKISIALDEWTTKTSMLPFLAVIGHWIDAEWRKQTVLLAFPHIPGSHTGIRLGEKVMEVLTNLGIPSKVENNYIVYSGIALLQIPNVYHAIVNADSRIAESCVAEWCSGRAFGR